MPGLEALQTHLTEARDGLSAALPAILRILIGLAILMALVVVGVVRLARGPAPDQTRPDRPRGSQSSPVPGGTAPGGHVVGGRSDGRPGGRMEWLTGEDFAVLAGEPPATMWGPCLEEGSVTLMPGVPKAGKSLVLGGLVGAVVAGLPDYLGWPVRARKGGEPVVVLCEETPRTYRHKAMLMAGVSPLPLGRCRRVAWRIVRAVRRRVMGVRTGKPDIYVRSGPLAGPKGAAHIRQHLIEAAELALEVGARLVVLDSIKHWCQEAVTQDDPAGVLMEAAKEVAGMTHPKTKMGLVVVIVHHLSETDGRMLGPTTLFSQADFRGKVTPPPRETVTSTKERIITWEGRFDGEAPEPLSYRMVDGRLEAGPAAPLSERPAVPAATVHSLPEGGASRLPPSTHPQSALVGHSANSLPAPLHLPILTPPTTPAPIPPHPQPTPACTNPDICEQILAFLHQRDGVTGGTIERATKIAHATFDRHIKHLLRADKVVTTGTGGPGDPRHYRLPLPSLLEAPLEQAAG